MNAILLKQSLHFLLIAHVTSVERTVKSKKPTGGYTESFVAYKDAEIFRLVSSFVLNILICLYIRNEYVEIIALFILIAGYNVEAN